MIALRKDCSHLLTLRGPLLLLQLTGQWALQALGNGQMRGARAVVAAGEPCFSKVQPERLRQAEQGCSPLIRHEVQIQHLQGNSVLPHDECQAEQSQVVDAKLRSKCQDTVSFLLRQASAEYLQGWQQVLSKQARPSRCWQLLISARFDSSTCRSG